MNYHFIIITNTKQNYNAHNTNNTNFLGSNINKHNNYIKKYHLEDKYYAIMPNFNTLKLGTMFHDQICFLPNLFLTVSSTVKIGLGLG